MLLASVLLFLVKSAVSFLNSVANNCIAKPNYEQMLGYHRMR